VVFDLVSALVSAVDKIQDANFVRSYNRLNVSLTRYKYELVFIGSKGLADHLSDIYKHSHRRPALESQAIDKAMSRA